MRDEGNRRREGACMNMFGYLGWNESISMALLNYIKRLCGNEVSLEMVGRDQKCPRPGKAKLDE